MRFVIRYWIRKENFLPSSSASELICWAFGINHKCHVSFFRRRLSDRKSKRIRFNKNLLRWKFETKFSKRTRLRLLSVSWLTIHISCSTDSPSTSQTPEEITRNWKVNDKNTLLLMDPSTKALLASGEEILLHYFSILSGALFLGRAKNNNTKRMTTCDL